MAVVVKGKSSTNKGDLDMGTHFVAVIRHANGQKETVTFAADTTLAELPSGIEKMWRVTLGTDIKVRQILGVKRGRS